MNNLKCPYCTKDIYIELDTTQFKEFTIQERLDVVEADGTKAPPTFLLSEPKHIYCDKKHILIRCSGCFRRFFEIAREAKIDEEGRQIILKNFSETKFKSWDSVMDYSKTNNSCKFVLKQRPKK